VSQGDGMLQPAVLSRMTEGRAVCVKGVRGEKYRWKRAINAFAVQ